MDLIKDVSQTALTTGERALRLFWDLLSVASERFREAAGQPRPLPMEPSPEYRERAPEPTPAPAPASEKKAEPKRAAAPARRGAAKPKAKKKPSAKGQLDKDRADQMIRVLELLAESSSPWQSAKELSDAGAAAGTPILPGNVRKVIRARGGDLIETRPREGSRRGALEYRITEAGRRSLGTKS